MTVFVQQRTRCAMRAEGFRAARDAPIVGDIVGDQRIGGLEIRRRDGGRPGFDSRFAAKRLCEKAKAADMAVPTRAPETRAPCEVVVVMRRGVRVIVVAIN